MAKTVVELQQMLKELEEKAARGEPPSDLSDPKVARRFWQEYHNDTFEELVRMGRYVRGQDRW